MNSASWLKTAILASTILFFAEPCWSKMIITRSTDQYLPGDSLPALAIALAQGAENVHLSLVMTADNQVVILSDTILNEITNAALIFPDKVRENGQFHAMDFTFEEMTQLSLLTPEPLRSPTASLPPPHLPIATLGQALGMIRIMESKLDIRVGIVGEIRKSWQYLHERKDLSAAVISVFKEYGYTSADGSLILASYDPEELQRVHDSLLPAAGIDAQILQLTEDNSGQQTKRFERTRWIAYNYDWLFTKFGLKAVSGYADFIGIKPSFLRDVYGDLLNQEYVEDVHILGMKLLVHPLEMQSESSADTLLSFEQILESLLFTAGADGLITSDDRLTREFIHKRTQENKAGKKTTIELLLENVKKQQTN